jgi:hypothetical protein
LLRATPRVGEVGRSALTSATASGGPPLGPLQRAYGPPARERQVCEEEDQHARAATHAKPVAARHRRARDGADIAECSTGKHRRGLDGADIAEPSTADIAGRLRISRHTLHDHLEPVFAAVGVRGRGELVSRPG